VTCSGNFALPAQKRQDKEIGGENNFIDKAKEIVEEFGKRLGKDEISDK